MLVTEVRVANKIGKVCCPGANNLVGETDEKQGHLREQFQGLIRAKEIKQSIVERGELGQ